jgi:hypothetical protein
MMVSAIAGVLLIFGLFLSMLSSSPKKDSEWHPDTERESLPHTVTPE